MTNTDDRLSENAKKTRPRDPEATKLRILRAATKEFSRSGLSGTRVDDIADRASINKRMLYHYFGSKESLFQAVLEDAYLGIRTAEQKLNLDLLDPEDALERLVRFTWGYYLKNPEFINLVNIENLYKAIHIKKSSVVRHISQKFVDMISRVLSRGVECGAFRSGIDPVQLYITIAAVSYYYITNRYTGSVVFNRDLMTREALDERISFNVDTVLRLVCKPSPVLPR